MVGGAVFAASRDLPAVREKLLGEKEKLRADLRKSLKDHGEGFSRNVALPAKGRADDSITQELQAFCAKEEARRLALAARFCPACFLRGASA